MVDKISKIIIVTRKAAQGVAQCEVSATRVVVDAAFRRIGKSRHGGNKIANVSVIIVNGFKNGFHQWIQHIFWW